MVLGIGVGLISGDFVLDGDPAPLLKKGAEPPPQFWLLQWERTGVESLNFPTREGWLDNCVSLCVSMTCVKWSRGWQVWYNKEGNWHTLHAMDAKAPIVEVGVY